MIIIFDRYDITDPIPVTKYSENRKMRKYFNRETEAAIVAVGKITDTTNIDPRTSFYYALGKLQFENYGLDAIADNSVDSRGRFNYRKFIEKGLPSVSPLNQFKVLQNMVLSFVTIVYGLQGEAAVVYESSESLITCAGHAAADRPILLGAGRTHVDGRVEIGMVYLKKEELNDLPIHDNIPGAVELLEYWSLERN